MITYGNNVKGYGVSKVQQPLPKEESKAKGDKRRNGRAVVVDGEKVYPSISQAAREIGADPTYLGQLLRESRDGETIAVGRKVAFLNI